ncbi:GNAT family N-acetyltransferase [Consotaella salsifontis]|uniref:Protein N-acetyltransferase, RimJ/RimL family n=1 Tax=Consotaella salsifontis TaxID=1365950 RepID=A0A1T4RXN4_9HYPH|nr:GNAT family N-acetyltransferase [Consotaella salsifontis]SKA20351.1 Protein N-acetyltransferase, RimJ/RimL family [Consotaella salsifontis]
MTEDEVDRTETIELPVLTTERLVLRPLVTADAPAMAALANDLRVAEMVASIPHPYSEDDALDFIASVAGHPAFAITSRDEGRLMGVVNLRPCSTPGAAELGYWLGHDYWGEGYATEAAHAIIDFGFRQFGLPLVEVACRAVNNASRRVIQKCGFQYIGTGMTRTLAAGSVATERYRMDKRLWQAIKAWGRS